MAAYFRYRKGEEPVPQHVLIELLGKGGFGEVWKARGPGGFFEALKIIDLTGNEGAKEFASLEVVRTMQHPNLVPIHGCWLKAEDQRLLTEDSFLVMTERMEGAGKASARTQTLASRPVELLIAMALGEMSLQAVLEKCRANGQPGIPVEELLEYMHDSAKAIDYLNDKTPSIVHGDIKPHNILLAGNSAQICDFGLCKAVQDIRKTQPTPVTVAYAAPESFSGKPTAKSDQYSLAITYVELRVGRLPFDDDTLSYPYKLMEAHKRGRLELDALSPEVRKVIRRATELDADKRWPTSRALVRALAFAEQVAPTDSNTTPSLLPLPDPSRTTNRGTDPAKSTPKGSTDETILPPSDAHDSNPFITSRPPSDSLTRAPIPNPRLAPSGRPSSVAREPSAAGRWLARVAAMCIGAALVAGLAYGGYRWLRPGGSKEECERLIAAGDFDPARTMIDNPDLPVLPAEKKALQKEWQEAWERDSLRLARGGKLAQTKARLADPAASTNKDFKENLQTEFRNSWQNACAQLVRDGKLDEAGKQLADADELIPIETKNSLNESLQTELRKSWRTRTVQLLRDGKLNDARKSMADAGGLMTPEIKKDLSGQWLDAWLDAKKTGVDKWSVKNDPLLELAGLRPAVLDDETAERGKQDLCAFWRTWAENFRIRQPTPSFIEFKSLLANVPPEIAATEKAEVDDLRAKALIQWKDERLGDIKPADSLDALAAAADFFPKEQTSSLGEFALGQWVRRAVDRSQEYDKPKVAEAGQISEAMLARPDALTPETRSELHLIRARALWLAGDRKGARDDLKAAAQGSPLADKLKLLHAALSVLANEGSDSDPQTKAVREKYNAVKILASSLQGILPLNPYERRELETGYVPPVAPKDPIESKTGNLADVQTAIGQKKFAAARQLLGKSKHDSSDAEYFETLISLADPSTANADVDQWFGLWPETLANAKPQQRDSLIAALGDFARREPKFPADVLQRTIQMVGVAHNGAPDDPKLTALHAELCSKRILSSLDALRAPPAPPFLKQIDEDYRFAVAATHPSGVDELWLECQALKSKPNLGQKEIVDAIKTTVNRQPADKRYRYSRYVLAVLRSSKPSVSRTKADWQYIHDQLVAACDAHSLASPELDEAPFRREQAAKLLFDAVGHLYTRQPAVPDAEVSTEDFTKRLSQPYASASDAETAYRSLNMIRDWSPTVANQAKYKLDLALAAWFRTAKPGQDPSTTSHLLSDMLDRDKVFLSASDDAKFERLMGDDELTVLVLSVEGESGKGGIPLNAVRWATRLARLASTQKWFIKNDAIAKLVYERVLAPAELLANAALPGKAPYLHEYYGETSRFIETYRYLDVADAWPRTKPLRYQKIEELLNRAIDDLGQREPSYLVRRGNSMVDFQRSPPLLPAALDDATAALNALKQTGIGVEPGQKASAELAGALSLRGLVNLLSARQSKCYTNRLKLREQSLNDLKWINQGNSGADMASVDDRAVNFILESMARLEQGNDLADSTAKFIELNAAVQAAQNANSLNGQHYPEAAFESLGNAWEDVASQVAHETDESYQKAIEAFDAAIDAKPLSPMLVRDRGRCLFKYFAWRMGSPKEAKPFRNLTTDQIGGLAEDDLKAALIGGGPAMAVQSHWFLAQFDQMRKKWPEADAHFASAIEAARKVNDPELALYIQSWATTPMYEFGDRFNKVHPATAADRKSFTDKITQRAEKLRAAAIPLQSLIEPKLEADLLLARSTIGVEGDAAAALAALKGLPDIVAEGQCDFDLSQVNLLKTRVDLRFAAIQQHKEKKTVTEAEVIDLMKDAYKLLGSKVVASLDKAFLSDKCAAVRLAVQFSDPPPSTAVALEYKKGALEDYRNAIDYSSRGGKPALAAQFKFSRAVVAYVYSLGLAAPAKKPVLTDALKDAQDAKQYFSQFSYPDGITPTEVDGRIIKIQEALK